MDRIIERCGGLDVHKDSITACVRVPSETGRSQETRTFATTTHQLLALRDWPVSFGVTLVGMESTGVYWKPVYYLLEDDLECWLPSAHHLKAVPGRKTDVRDAEWIRCESLSSRSGKSREVMRCTQLPNPWSRSRCRDERRKWS